MRIFILILIIIISEIPESDNGISEHSINGQHEDVTESIVIKCYFCDVSLTHEMEDMLYHCNTCSARTRSSSSHKYTCFLCDYNTYYRESMRKHIRTHLGMKPYKCSMCNYSAAQKNTLKRHVNKHLGDFPFSCSLCGFVASRCYILTKHIRDKHENIEPEIEEIES